MQEGSIKWMVALWRGQGSNDQALAQAATGVWARHLSHLVALESLVVDLPVYPDGDNEGGPVAMVTVRISVDSDTRFVDSIERATAAVPEIGRSQSWRVVEHVRKSDPGRVVAGGAVAGKADRAVKMVACMRAPRDLQAPQCLRYWLDHHAPLALRVHVGMADYRQNEVVYPQAPDNDGVYAISELYFRSDQDYAERFFESDAGREEIFADVPSFLDVAASWTLITRPHPVQLS